MRGARVMSHELTKLGASCRPLGQGCAGSILRGRPHDVRTVGIPLSASSLSPCD